MEEIGCSKTQFLHVGDSLTNDVMGTIDMGIKCVWLNRNRAKNHLGIKIDHGMHRLSDLLGIL